MADVTQIAPPWMPRDVAQAYLDLWAELGDPQLALSELRKTPVYEAAFPGIKRDDGSLRFSEKDYMAQVFDIEQTFKTYGLEGLFDRNQIGEFLANGWDSRQVATTTAQMFVNTSQSMEAIRAAYAADGIVASDRAIFASILDPELDPVTAEQKLRSFDVIGAADDFGFTIALSESERLADFGLAGEAARRFFSRAQTLVPSITELAARHNDPDDDFDISEAADALVFQNPDQVDRIERLLSQEAASFTQGTIAQDPRGGLAGLGAR